MKSIRLEGLALPFTQFVDSESRRRTKFLPTAFREWLSTDLPSIVPVRVNHEITIGLPTFCCSWRWTEPGLMVGFNLRTDLPRGRLAAMAVARGYLPHLSVTAGMSKPITMADGIGKLDLIPRATVHELSLTNRPIIPGTHVGIAREEAATVKTLPKDDADRAALVKFLTEAGIDPAPTPPSSTRVESKLHRDWRLAEKRRQDVRALKALTKATKTDRWPSQSTILVPCHD